MLKIIKTRKSYKTCNKNHRKQKNFSDMKERLEIFYDPVHKI